MNKKILKRIEEIFAEKLQSKTGWGRNEIMQAYKESVNEALIELLDIRNRLTPYGRIVVTPKY